VKRNHEERALVLLQEIIDMDRGDRDALPGSVVSKVKEAAVILKKRRSKRRVQEKWSRGSTQAGW